MPKPRSRERWEHPNYKYAYIINRNGICYTIINGQEKKAIKHLEFKLSNKKDALKILNLRLIEILNQNDKSYITIGKAFKEFMQNNDNKISLKTIKYYLSAFDCLINDPDIKLNDSFKIRNMINNNLRLSKLKDSSKNRYLNQIKTFFNYCIQNDYIEKNPINQTMILNNPKKEILTFTIKELNKILDYSKKNFPIEFYLSIKFLSLSGLRINEFMNLYKSEKDAPIISYTNNLKSCVYDKYILVDGKRSNFKIPKIREIPIDIIPNLRETINELIITSKYNTLFPFSNYNYFRLKFNKILNKNNISDKFTLHTLRKFATNYWENDLKFSSKICENLGGHNKEIRKDNYVTKLDAETIVSLLSDLSPIKII